MTGFIVEECSYNDSTIHSFLSSFLMYENDNDIVLPHVYAAKGKNVERCVKTIFDGILVGVAAFERNSKRNRENQGNSVHQLRYLAVHDKFKRLGIGTIMFQFAFEEFPCFSSFRVKVHTRNKSGLKFYKSVGCQKCSLQFYSLQKRNFYKRISVITEKSEKMIQ